MTIKNAILVVMLAPVLCWSAPIVAQMRPDPPTYDPRLPAPLYIPSTPLGRKPNPPSFHPANPARDPKPWVPGTAPWTEWKPSQISPADFPGPPWPDSECGAAYASDDSQQEICVNCYCAATAARVQLCASAMGPYLPGESLLEQYAEFVKLCRMLTPSEAIK